MTNFLVLKFKKSVEISINYVMTELIFKLVEINVLQIFILNKTFKNKVFNVKLNQAHTLGSPKYDYF